MITYLPLEFLHRLVPLVQLHVYILMFNRLLFLTERWRDCWQNWWAGQVCLILIFTFKISSHLKQRNIMTLKWSRLCPAVNMSCTETMFLFQNQECDSEGWIWVPGLNYYEKALKAEEREGSNRESWSVWTPLSLWSVQDIQLNVTFLKISTVYLKVLIIFIWIYEANKCKK